MTLSDLEQTLAEARATAARRLAALNRLEGGHAVQPEPIMVARARPAQDAGQSTQEVVAAYPRQFNEPDAVSVGAPRSEPLAAYRQYQDVAIDYVQVEGVVADQRMNPRSAIRARLPDDVGAVGPEGATARDLAARVMGSLVAGISNLRERYAQRRALAKAESIERVAAPLPQKHRLTEKERRWERRRKRYLFEEILGWILVPVILVALYFAAIWVLELFGTTPDALIEGVKTIWTQFR